MTDPFARLYKTTRHDSEPFGDKWTMTDNATLTRDWMPCAYYGATSEDGDDVEVEVAALPARSWRIRAGTTEGFVTISTGSGSEMAALIARLAEAIASGMVGIEYTADADATVTRN